MQYAVKAFVPVCVFVSLLCVSHYAFTCDGYTNPVAVSKPETANLIFGHKVGGGSSKVSQIITFDGSDSIPDQIYTGSITDYAWDFGDGTTGSGVTVTHSYTATGSYTVTLTVTDDLSKTDTDTSSIYVDEITWSMLGPGGGGAMLATAIDPSDENTVFVGADNAGLFRTTDGGSMWENLNDKGIIGNGRSGHNGIEEIVFDRNNTNIIYSCNWINIFKSTDRGDSWNMLVPDKNNIAYYSCLAIDPADSDTLYTGHGVRFRDKWSGGEVYKSTDGGSNWEKITYDENGNCKIDEEADIYAIEVDSHPGEHYLYLATSGGFFRSTDNGSNWEQKGSGVLPNDICRDLDLSYASQTSSTTLYLTLKTTLIEGTWNGGVWKSTDRGENWSDSNGDLPQYNNTNYKIPYYHRITAHPTDDNIAFVSLKGDASDGIDWPVKRGLYKTTNGGNNWEWITRYTTNGGTEKNMTSGWCDAASGWWPYPFAVDISSDANTVYFTRNTIHKSTDAGDNWTQSYTIETTSNSVVNWQGRGTEVTHAYNITVDPANADNLYIAYDDIGFWRSTNQGSTFFNKTTGDGKGFNRPSTDLYPYSLGDDYQISIDPLNPNQLYRTAGHGTYLDRGSLFGSINYGDDWVDLVDENSMPPSRILSYLVFEDSQNTGKRIICAADYGIGFYRGTHDKTADPLAAIEFEKKGTNAGYELGTTDNQFIRCLASDPADNNTIFAAIYWDKQYFSEINDFNKFGGIYKTTDMGDNWTQIDGSQIPNCRAVVVDTEDSNILYAAAFDHTTWGTNSYSGGVWKGSYDSATSNWAWSLKFTNAPAGTGTKTFIGAVAINPDNVCYPSGKNLIFAHSNERYWHYFAGTDNVGLYVSPNDGETWFKQSEGLKSDGLNSINLDPNDSHRVYLGSKGNGFFKGEFTRWQ